MCTFPESVYSTYSQYLVPAVAMTHHTFHMLHELFEEGLEIYFVESRTSISTQLDQEKVGEQVQPLSWCHVTKTTIEMLKGGTMDFILNINGVDG